MSEATPQPAPLLPIDYVFTGVGAYPVEFVFYYDYAIDVERFALALKKTLTDFHLVSSRLQEAGEAGYQLQPCGQGLVFRTTDVAGDMELGNPYTYLDSVQTVVGEPLTRIRLTRVGQGSVLAVSISHLVADGFSCFYFLSELAKAFKGQAVSRPDGRRDWYVPAPIDVPQRLTNGEALERTGFALAGQRREIPRERIVWENLLVSQKEIDALLAEASRHTDCRLSRNDVLTAHLWKTYVPKWHRNGALNQPNFSLPFDVRRFSDWVSGRYFGNGICLASGALAGERFLEANLAELALVVRRTVDKVSRDYVQGSYDLFEAFRRRFGLGAMQGFHVADPGEGLLVTNMSRVPLESVDFGAGQPFRFFPATPTPRTAIVLPAADGVKIDVCYPFD